MKLSVETGVYVSFIRDVANDEVHVALNGKPICEADILGDRVGADEFVDGACATCADRVNPRDGAFRRAAARKGRGGFGGPTPPPEVQRFAEAVGKAVQENLPANGFGNLGNGFPGVGIGFMVLDEDDEDEETSTY